MKVIFCEPKLTMDKTDYADVFFKSCKEILDAYITNKIYISSFFQVNQLIAESAEPDDIFIFFNSEKWKYDDSFLSLIKI